jgi:hypothetical protein
MTYESYLLERLGKAFESNSILINSDYLSCAVVTELSDLIHAEVLSTTELSACDAQKEFLISQQKACSYAL